LPKILFKKRHKKICFVKIVAYICTRFWSEELIEGLKEIGFRLQEEGKEDGEKAGKIISFFLAERRVIINFDVPKQNRFSGEQFKENFCSLK
jgi:hypothetical protein